MNPDLLQLFAKMLGGAPGLAAGGGQAGGAAALGGLLPGLAAGGNPMMALGGIIPGMLANQSKSPATPETANPAAPMPMEGGGATPNPRQIGDGIGSIMGTAMPGLPPPAPPVGAMPAPGAPAGRPPFSPAPSGAGGFAQMPQQGFYQMLQQMFGQGGPQTR